MLATQRKIEKIKIRNKQKKPDKIQYILHDAICTNSNKWKASIGQKANKQLPGVVIASRGESIPGGMSKLWGTEYLDLLDCVYM